jgi:hypothetical protein
MKYGALLLTLLLSACASGTIVLTGHARAPISADAVVLYVTPPAHYEVIGLVNAHAAHGWTDQGRMDKAVAELKEQAADVGANGVLVGSTGVGIGGTAGVAVPTGGGGAIFVASDSHDQQISGTAIYVPPTP